MAEVKSKSDLQITITITLSEVEARALHTITTYGTKNFLETFYEKLGRSYLEPYEKGIESLFFTLDRQIPEHIRKIDKARKAFYSKD